MTPDERRELIARYRRAARSLVEVAAGLSEDDLDLKQADGGWTPRWVLHHVADTELRAAARLHRLVAENAPSIPAFDGDMYAQRLHYERPASSSVALIAALVDSNVELLERLSEGEWHREGHHEELGRYSVETWLGARPDHCEQHADQLRTAAASRS